MNPKSLFLVPLTGILVACGPASVIRSSGAQAQAGEARSAENAVCPLTQPPSPAFVPPDPWPAKPPPGGGQAGLFWVGQAGLWTALPADWRWPQLAHGDKFWWWSQWFDVKQDETPDLHLVATRLDGPAATVELTEATNAYHPSFEWAMLAGVELPSPGCWQIVANYKGEQLTVVIDVAAE